MEYWSQLVRLSVYCSLCCGFETKVNLRLQTLALCTWADSTYPIRSQVAFCYYSSNVLYSGVAGAGTETEYDFYAYPYAVWGKEGYTSDTSKHYRGRMRPSWSYGPDWSGSPLSVRCVVALKQRIGLWLQTLALCTVTADTSSSIRSQVAYCARSSKVLYSGVLGAGTEATWDFYAYPDTVWAKERDTTSVSQHYRCYLGASWGCGGTRSGAPLSVRCVVALKQSGVK